MREDRSAYYGGAVLLLLLLGLALFYGYPALLTDIPRGAHLWRQADCLAMTWNYKLFGLSFAEPAIFNLQSDGGRVAGEFPLFYFLAAHASNPEFVLRVLHTLVFFAGLFGVYAVALHFLKSSLLSAAAALLLFTSPLLVFYGNNFLSDVPAWSMAMIGWAFFLPGHKKDDTVLIALAFLCFAFAALLKASHALNFIIAVIFQLSTFNFQLSTKRLLPYSLFLIPLSWYIYARWYNAQHHDTYYFLGVFPAWKMPLEDIARTGWRMLVSWSGNYFWRPASVFLLAGLLYALVRRPFPETDLKRLLLISLGLTALYVLLFFERLKLHEYYYTFFFVFGAFAVITVLSLFRSFTQNNYFRLFLLLFLAINSFCCRGTLRQKLTVPAPNGTLAGNGFQRFLLANGCTTDKTVLVLPDASVSQSLYWIKRKGFTAYNDVEGVLNGCRAEFAVVYSEGNSMDEKLRPYVADSLGSFETVRLYRLKVPR